MQPNQRLQLAGAARPGLHPGAVRRWRTVDHRIRNVRAFRPQLNREALGCRRPSCQTDREGGNNSLRSVRALRPGLEALAALHHTAAALRVQARLRSTGLWVTVLRSDAERRNRSFPQARARGSMPAWRGFGLAVGTSGRKWLLAAA